MSALQRKVQRYMAENNLSHWKLSKQIGLSYKGFQDFMERPGGNCRRKTRLKLQEFLKDHKVMASLTNENLTCFTAKQEAVDSADAISSKIMPAPTNPITPIETNKPINWRPIYAIAPWVITIVSVGAMLWGHHG